jgi:tetratricopeptide (TPR) repeat protein
MKHPCLITLLFLLAPIVHGQAGPNVATSAQQKIAWAQAAIKAHPDSSQPYNDLAVACARRVRETADDSYYDQAQAALQKSFQMGADNLEGQKAQLMILLGRGEFARALDLAQALNKKMPDDVLLYGFVADAAIELGDYNDAETAIQWMLDLRPGNVPGLLRGARLRRLYGDAEGAMQFFSQAYQQMPPTQTEDLAWTLTQMADLQLSVGNSAAAEDLLHSALQKFPGYYLAMESLARVHIARQHYLQAVELLRQRNLSFPTTASRYALAQVLELAGQSVEADSAYKEFERNARGVINAARNANTLLILYYLNHGNNAAEALRIAQLAIAQRHDVSTLDAYAWALYANAHYEEAQKQIVSAMAPGVREAGIFYHAGMIAGKLKNNASAVRYLRESLALDSSSLSAETAREALAKLAPASAATGGEN